MRCSSEGGWARALAAVLCLAVAWTPWALAWGDAFANAAGQGQAAGTSAREAVALPQAANGQASAPGGGISFSTLFPGAGAGDAGGYSALYGSNAGVVGAGQGAQQSLTTEQSQTGRAYRALLGAVNRNRPDMRNDPLWGGTDHVLDNFNDLARDFAQCSTITRFANETRMQHVPDYRVCERLPNLDVNCEILHQYGLPVGSAPVQVNWSDDNLAPCCHTEWQHADGSWQATQPWKYDFVQHGGFYDWEWVPDDDAPSKQVCPELSGCGEASFGWGSGYAYANVREGARVTDARGWICYRHNGDSDCVSNIDLNWYMRGAGLVLIDLRPRAPAGAQITQSGMTLQYAMASQPTSDVWTGEACASAAGRLNSPFCGGSITCADMPPLGADGCYSAPGVHVCEGALKAAPVAGINRFCRRAVVTVDCGRFNRGAMACWTDPQGARQCPSSDGSNRNACAALEADPTCGFVKQQCVQGAADSLGNCFASEEVWDCGRQQAVPVLNRSQEIDCAGPVRCMGTECASFPSEQSYDFGKAVAALQAAQMAVSDAACDTNGHCIVFSGEHAECKKAMGGIVNCCTTPDGISLGNYIALILAVGKIDAALMGLNKGNQVRGAWETLRGPVTSTWSAVKESFTSVANNLMGSTTPAATDAAANAGVAAFRQQILTQVAEWTAQVFGDVAANSLFSLAEGGGAALSGGSALGPVQLGGGAAWLGTAMSMVMWAYTAYMVAMLLVKLIWTCEEKELELGAKRELRACHFVGGYCKSDVLGYCVEKRDSYCCFNTPLARIMNEQIRPQLGRGWGNGKTPDCAGIDVADFGRIDWNQVDLSEWLALLMESGQFPTADSISIEDLTGTGSAFAAGNTRADAMERTVERAQGIDAEAVRMNAEGELWEGTLGVLPQPAATAP